MSPLCFAVAFFSLQWLSIGAFLFGAVSILDVPILRQPLLLSGKGGQLLFGSTFRYKPEHVDCRLCTQSDGKHCTEKVCPWWEERMGAGVIRYQDVILETVPRSFHPNGHLHKTADSLSGSLFLTHAHKQRMRRVKSRRKHRDAPIYDAALYLLTANADIYARTADCLRGCGIAFNQAEVKGISPHNYTLLAAAKDIYTDGSRVTLRDLAVSEIVDALAFQLIVNALLIARCGHAVLKNCGKESRP